MNIFLKLISIKHRQNDNPRYRPGIDGLRALAALSVVFYHAGVNTLSGGFIGVDIFFVISGYLITRLLTNEFAQNGKIDFYAFYLRRLRRILPTLFFTLIATAIASIAILTPQRLETFGASLLHSAISASNIYFFYGSGYFDTDAELKPLLHTWSLGVEEQFYIFWPLLIFLAGVYGRKTVAIIGIIGIASIIAATQIIKSNPSAAFYLVPFRVFEFTIGAILVYLEKYRPRHSQVDSVCFSAGLLCLIYPLFAYSKHTQFPALSALPPCLGTALCIYSSDRTNLGKVFTNKLARGLGLISYSLYLAHWPIVVMYRYYFDISNFSHYDTLIIISASIILATLMYFFVEKPFRKPRSDNRNFLISLTLITIATAYLGASLWATNGWAWRSWAREQLSLHQIEAGKELRFKTRKNQCERKGWEHCDDIESGNINALIIGDSHAPDALNAFYKIYPSHNFIMSTLGGCPPYADIANIVAPSHPDLNDCKKLNTERYNENYLKQFDYVVINLLFSSWYTQEHLQEYLHFLKKIGVSKVVVFGGYLTMSDELPDLINKHGFSTSRLDQFIESKADDSVIRSVTERLGYFFVSKRAVFCVADRCELFDTNHIPFSYDKNHLSYEFASRLVIENQKAISNYLELGNSSKENAAKDNTDPKTSSRTSLFTGTAAAEESIAFREVQLPQHVESISGLSGAESFGRWSEQKIIIIQFNKLLPRKFTVTINAGAYGDNRNNPAVIRVGTQVRKLLIDAPYAEPQEFSVDFANVENATSISIEVPNPTAPKSIGQGEDIRALGYSFVALSIHRRE